MPLFKRHNACMTMNVGNEQRRADFAGVDASGIDIRDRCVLKCTVNFYSRIKISFNFLFQIKVRI